MNQSGRVLSGRYHIGEPVFSDATVVVHRGHDQILNRPVTLELLKTDAPSSAGLALQEKARRMALAELPHVAALYDQGEQSGQLYLVLEDLIGVPLAETAPLRPDRTLALMVALIAVLRAAQQKGVPAPRVSADTVRITDDGLVQVASWGITPNGNAGPPTDVARIAPLLALAVTGSTSGAKQAGRKQRGTPSSPLHRVVERALAGQIRSLDELEGEVHQATAVAEEATVAVPRGQPTVLVPVEQEQPAAYAQPVRRTQRWPMLLLVVVLVLAAGAAVYGRSFGERETGTIDTTDVQPTVTSAAPTEPTAAPTSPPETGEPYIVATIAGQRLNVRSGPGRSNAIVGKLTNGTEVRVLEGPVSSDGLNWARIEGDGVAGWCVFEALRPR